MNQEVVLILFRFTALIFAFSVHEAAHAWMASRLGDQTARMLGRVTLNPIKHIDPLGSVLFPLIGAFYGGFMVGWAKPTPVTPRNFKNYKRDDILVTVAGPLSNVGFAIVCVLLLALIKHAVPGGWQAIISASSFAMKDPGVAIGAGILFPLCLLLYVSILINLLLFVFNLIPIPPLDGSRVFMHFLPARLQSMYSRLGMFSLLILWFVSGRFIAVFYYPLLGVFNGALNAL